MRNPEVITRKRSSNCFYGTQNSQQLLQFKISRGTWSGSSFAINSCPKILKGQINANRVSLAWKQPKITQRHSSVDYVCSVAMTTVRSSQFVDL